MPHKGSLIAVAILSFATKASSALLKSNVKSKEFESNMKPTELNGPETFPLVNKSKTTAASMTKVPVRGITMQMQGKKQILPLLKKKRFYQHWFIKFVMGNFRSTLSRSF